MIEVRQTERFAKWYANLRDIVARKAIARRIALLQQGHFGDAKRFDGIGELRIDHGPGYRLYFVQHGATIVVLLIGGDKGSQRRDITQAKEMAAQL